MSLTIRLAEALRRDHPERAAAVLERAPVVEAARALSTEDAVVAAPVVRSMSPGAAARLLVELDVEIATPLLAALELDEAARLLRALPEGAQRAIVERSPQDTAAALRAVLRFPPGTAGALMDPQVVGLPQDLTAREALAQIREQAQNTRYNVYVVDREQRLVGVLNLRELLLAKPQARLAELMIGEPAHLDARADESTVLDHPGWKEVHALPVVDDAGRYIGAIRYRVLRALQEKHLARPREDSSTTEALGELFAAGAAGLLDALTGSAGPGRTKGK
jgi:magnesium transporter